MKILVLQLARFGDILMTGPVLKALRRQYPSAQIDLVVRGKFQEASQMLEGHSNVHVLDSAEIIGPLIQPDMNEALAFTKTFEIVQRLRAESYNQVINLSFSPASSWLTKMVAGPDSTVKGYSRFADGSFRICDDASEYFYSQVGVGRYNRFPLINVMGAVAGVDILLEDMTLSKPLETPITIPPRAIAIHIGASQEGKRIPALKWTSLIREFSELNPNHPIVLLGSAAEQADADRIAASIGQAQVFNYVGRTKWSDVLAILAKVRLLVAGDSSLIQAANLVGTACFNLSNDTVNFWETGPRSPGSFVYLGEDFDLLDTKQVASMVNDILAGWTPDNLHRATTDLPAFEGPFTGTEFHWSLIAALYWGGDFPKLPPPQTDALRHLNNLNDVVIENLQKASKIEPATLEQILKRADEIQDLIANQFPELYPMFGLFLTERIRIAPGTREEIIQGMINCHQRWGTTIQTFLAFQQPNMEAPVDGQL